MPSLVLYPGPELVPERLDDLVGGHAHVGRPLLEHHEDRADDPADRGDLHAVVVEVGRDGEVVAEQLVRAVDQMDLHRGHDTPDREGQPRPGVGTFAEYGYAQ